MGISDPIPGITGYDVGRVPAFIDTAQEAEQDEAAVDVTDLEDRVTTLEEAGGGGAGDANQMLFLFGDNTILNIGSAQSPIMIGITSMLIPGYADPAWGSISGGALVLSETGLYCVSLPQIILQDLTDDEKFRLTVFLQQGGNQLPDSQREASLIPGADTGKIATKALMINGVSSAAAISIRLFLATSGPDTEYRCQGNSVGIVSKLV